MPQFRIYQQLEFPAVYKWQAIAFMRMEWTSIFYDDNLYMSETYPSELQPVHFVMAEDDTLISYASILRLNITHVGNDYQVYGFGNLLTFPPFRSMAMVDRFYRLLRISSGRVMWMPRSCSVTLCWSHSMPINAGSLRTVRLGSEARISTKTILRRG